MRYTITWQRLTAFQMAHLIRAAESIGVPEPIVALDDKFDVVLTGCGQNKIAVIKALRELTGLGLKDAKDLVDGEMPVVVGRALTDDEAKRYQEALFAAGASVVQ